MRISDWSSDVCSSDLEQVGERLGIDFAAHWRPAADNYWGRVRKSHALEIGAAVLGSSWHRDHAKDKKPVLAKALEAAFAGDGATTLGLGPETAARTSAWVPPGMRSEERRGGQECVGRGRDRGS